MGAGSMNTGVIAGLFTGIQVGAAIFASHFIVGEVGVGLLGFLRYGIALLFLLPVLFIHPSEPIARRDGLMVGLLGMGQIGVMITLINTAVLHTSAARVALVFATLPAVSFTIDKLRGNPSGGWLTKIGITLTIAGVAVLVGYDAFAGTLTVSDVIGIGAAFGATVAVAACSSWYQPYIRRYGTTKVSVIAFTVSLAPLAMLAVLLPSSTPFIDWSWDVWGLVLAVGLSSGIGYLMWFHAISVMPATAVTGFLALSPITAAVLSLFFADSSLTPSLLLAVVMVSVGIGCFALSKSKTT
jgi:drug/metabolite transporter (DMT)-like permease